MNTSRLLDTFEGHAFLKGLNERHLMRLAGGAKPFTIPAGGFLGREGQTAKAFYLIQSGQAQLGGRDRNDAFQPIAEVGPGEVVGWSWLLEPHRWQFDCQALNEVRGVAFDAEWLREQCETDHELGYHLLKHLIAVVAGRLTASRRAARQGITRPDTNGRSKP